jgi:hypothetical protein
LCTIESSLGITWIYLERRRRRVKSLLCVDFTRRRNLREQWLSSPIQFFLDIRIVSRPCCLSGLRSKKLDLTAGVQSWLWAVAQYTWPDSSCRISFSLDYGSFPSRLNQKVGVCVCVCVCVCVSLCVYTELLNICMFKRLVKCWQCEEIIRLPKNVGVIHTCFTTIIDLNSDTIFFSFLFFLFF